MHPDPKELFEHRLAWLEDFVEGPSTLTVYDAAAVIRQLLLDQYPLVDRVNRIVRTRLDFIVNVVPESLLVNLGKDHMVIFAGAALSPGSGTPELTTVVLTRDQFLQQPVLITASHRITVRELVIWAANKAGGIHFDTEPDPVTTLLNRYMRAFDSDEHQLFASSIVSISEILLRALAPLRSKLSALAE